MKAVHFGAGNIGRGFIGEILHKNKFEVTFVDVNQEIIEQLKTEGKYMIGLADESHQQISIDQVTGLNNQLEPEKVLLAMLDVDIITTAIGPNILPLIAPLLAQGIQLREKENIEQTLDIVACENMIGGSSFLKEEIKKHLSDITYLDEWIGFPDAAVDRIVPAQSHEDILYVEVEPFSEWVINKKQMKNPKLVLEGVHYVDDLEPYIERKLFSVNTGHATVAYTGALLGYQTIDEAMEDSLVLAQLKAVLAETGELLVTKWGFDKDEHNKYIEKIIKRFQNKYISDSISRVARTPIRKLGYEERFIRPIREMGTYDIEANHLIAMAGMVLNYKDPADEESQRLQEMLNKQDMKSVIAEITNINDESLLVEMTIDAKRYAKK
ncbi:MULTISPECIES: mannitol-1-phosphate 5-dehydrogenase [Vagococcus]|uniref:Mannitol-1-phosphate 5-dehydrogenase n=1 Tax=Vagococcus fluvialis bH819 TaxID=1255619 RepID=A0A1X6WKE0_9ENTE|nr:MULTISPECIES: mannitol-1-phosphate 5-dehydrogenase [Vagococcus]SLM84735.1 Mannitol-1-phosphate 5-dehydrogenase [Vagococcus fluvialis bH819]HCM89803.1 mannitol-1-phosphate 5-dehydrogenase [Vagococcus sp.]